jgi:hypothetical protein
LALSFYPSGFEEFFGDPAEGLDAGNVGERIVQAGGRLRCYFRAGTDPEPSRFENLYGANR